MALTAAWLLAYGLTIAGGFIRDDFAWIRSDAVSGQRLVVLEDDLSTRANFRHVFGGLLPEAAKLLFDDVSLWIEPPPPEIDVAAKPANPGRIITFRLVAGRVELERVERLTLAGPSP